MYKSKWKEDKEVEESVGWVNVVIVIVLWGGIVYWLYNSMN